MSVKVQSSTYSRLFEGFSFVILFILPFLLVWAITSSYQNKIDTENKEKTQEEMSELTAHMYRLADPQTFIQHQLLNLNKNIFKWHSDDILDIQPPDIGVSADYFLFNEIGKRIAWPKGNNSIKVISESYMSLITKLRENPNIILTKQELTTAKMFSGSGSTPQALVNSQDTLINLQSLGTKKYGAFFRTEFKDGTKGSMLVFINIKDIDTAKYASNAVKYMNNQFNKTLYQDKYKFCWLNLNNASDLSGVEKNSFSLNELLVLNDSNTVTDFEYDGNLYSTIDTSEGIRLICKSPKPISIGLTKTYSSILICIIPTFIFLYCWKLLFNIKIPFSTGTSFLFLVTYMAILGTALIIGGLSIYQKEQQKALIENHKQRAEAILAKVDKNYDTSFAELKREYRSFVKQLSEKNSNAKEILEPLINAYNENEIVFAGYLNTKNEYEFVVPNVKEGNQNYASKYYALVQPFNEQFLDVYNSSRDNEAYGNNVRKNALKVVSGRPVSAMLFNRSDFQNMVFADKETLCFLDLAINEENDVAKGGLFIIHDSIRLPLRYLRQARHSISAETGFSLVAFPKNQMNQSLYFPSYTLRNEEPLWKLNDLVNRSQIVNFKTGLIDEKPSLVACLPGYNLKDFNLFLIMPLSSITEASNQLSNFYLTAIIITILFILITGFQLTKSIFGPINLLKKHLSTVKENRKVNLVSYSENNKLVSVSAGLADFVIKSKEFAEKTEDNSLLPKMPVSNNKFEINGFKISLSNPSREFFTYASADESNSYAYIMRNNLNGSTATYIPTVCKQAVKLTFEDLNIHSAAQCIKDLADFFRIKLKQDYLCDSVMIHIPYNDNKIYYCGIGHFTIYRINKEKTIDTITLPQISGDFSQLSNIALDCEPETTIIAVSEYLQNNTNIKEILKNNLNNENYCEKIKECCLKELNDNKSASDTGCVLIIKFLGNDN